MNRHPCLRRLYAGETVEFLPRAQIDVPVNSLWTMLSPTAVNWLVEPREYREGVLFARTLLSSGGQQAYVRGINCGPPACTLPAGEWLATAEIVEYQGTSKLRVDGDTNLD